MFHAANKGVEYIKSGYEANENIITVYRLQKLINNALSILHWVSPDRVVGHDDPIWRLFPPAPTVISQYELPYYRS